MSVLPIFIRGSTYYKGYSSVKGMSYNHVYLCCSRLIKNIGMQWVQKKDQLFPAGVQKSCHSNGMDILRNLHLFITFIQTLKQLAVPPHLPDNQKNISSLVQMLINCGLDNNNFLCYSCIMQQGSITVCHILGAQGSSISNIQYPKQGLLKC